MTDAHQKLVTDVMLDREGAWERLRDELVRLEAIEARWQEALAKAHDKRDVDAEKDFLAHIKL